MKGYSARVRMTVYSNKTKQVYELQQRVIAAKQAEIIITAPESLKGLTYLYEGETVTLRRPGMEEVHLATLPTFDYTRLDEFFALYYQSEDTSISTGGADGTGSVLLETAVLPRESERYRLTLLLEGQKPIPKCLTLYDVGGNIRMTAEFFDFYLS